MDFTELLAMLQNPGEDGLPETIYDDIAGSYNHAVETRDAKIGELEALIQNHEAEVSALKAANYDLMMHAAPAEEGETEDAETEDEADEAETISIDDLFDNE